MTPEQNEPQGFAEAPAAFPPAAAPAADNSASGQQNAPSHSSRRRRRRKKSKGGQQNGQPQNAGQNQGQSQGQGSQQASGGQPPRKQKKFFQKQQNPGNGYGNGGGKQRKQKQRKQQPSFVGPMDHSYRAANGNVADGPPSTMDFRSNGGPNGNIASYADSPYEAPVSMRQDAPTRIFCFIDDLFFNAKINEVSRKTGIKVGFIKGADKEAIAKLTDAPEEERPSLIIFDLNNANAKPLTLIPKLKTKLKRGTSIIGFLSHIQGDLKAKAIEAGCDTVMPRSAFSQNLPNLLRRHAEEEEEELETLEA
uniref:Response regulator n=1 Tax=Acidobacterium capsulatum TaxID=33075 RepID=A0A7V4XRH3_9BACT